MAYATVEDVEAALGRTLDPAERELVSTRLEHAELRIKARIPNLDERIANGDLSEDLVAMVEVDAVLRVLRNPEGIAQESDGNYSYRLDGSTASGRLEILPDEWALLGIRSGLTILTPQYNYPWCTSGSPINSWEVG